MLKRATDTSGTMVEYVNNEKRLFPTHVDYMLRSSMIELKES